MRLSVVICTRNRADSLREVLRSISLCEQPPAGDWELVVIDNASEDHTAAVAQEFKGVLQLSLHRENQAGLSHARNCGVRAASGEWIVWTDDDVTVERHWLSSYYAAIERHPDAAVFGGPINAVLEGRPEAWLQRGLDHVKSAFAALSADDLELSFDGAGGVPYGANFALRRRFLELNPFDANLGRHPDHRFRGGEETYAIHGALKHGKGYWLREAPVWHHIDPARQTRRYLRSFYFDFGYRHALDFTAKPSRWQRARRMFDCFRAAVCADARLLLRRDLEHTTQLLKLAGRSWGQCTGLLRSFCLPRTERMVAGESNGH